MIRTRKKRPLRLSPIDYIASLARSDAYVDDYERYDALYETERDEKRRGIFNRVEGDATQDFLNRWPLILEPIIPAYARKSPMRYLNDLLPAVFYEMDIPPGRFKAAHKLPWPEGRFLPVWINFFRPESEIIAGIKALSKTMRFPGFKESVSKAQGMPDPWTVWDTFKGEGMENIRKTAETLFPDSFMYGDNQKEMEDEAKIKYEAKRESGSAHRAETWYDNRLAKAKAAEWRQDERKKLIAYVREVIGSCRQKIEMHSPVTDELPIVSVRLTNCSEKDNLPS